jgi:maltooligosyltrehalose trehalohydrolase
MVCNGFVVSMTTRFTESCETPTRRLPVGAETLISGQVSFRIWAPKRRRCTLELRRAADFDTAINIEMTAESGGYFSCIAPVAKPGMRYGFRLDAGDQLFPDPASRFQPDGPAKPSQIVDPGAFSWSDDSWAGVKPHGQVLYEMHIGTFTPEGTWSAAARELEELARIGITVVELMPAAEFHGKFGWGYDGVLLFAPFHHYGEPDDFRRFVDQAHALGLGVILDVVFNHFGICDNYIYEFSDHYKSSRYSNEWADAINFDGEHSAAVRDFFIANARYWIEEFHLDGYRFDAIQAVFDASTPHILSDVTMAAREAAAGRDLYLIAENELQDARTVTATASAGFGMNAVWNDDFHHAARVCTTGRNPAYYSDYRGNSQEFISAIKRGYLYQGQRSGWQKKPRGTSTLGLVATNFVSFLQNHDQVANSASGERLHQLTSPGKYRAITALWLLAPQTPLIFQGQEFAASTPFLYFADYTGELAEAVTSGRGKFLKQFRTLASPKAQSRLPKPTAFETFARSKLDFAERETHAAAYALHFDLLKLRRDDAVFSRQRADRLDGAVINADCFILRFFSDDGDDRLLIVNFGCDLEYSTAPEPLLAPPADRAWKMLWNSEDVRYGGHGECSLEVDDGWFFPGESLCVLCATSLPSNESDA